MKYSVSVAVFHPIQQHVSVRRFLVSAQVVLVNECGQVDRQQGKDQVDAGTLHKNVQQGDDLRRVGEDLITLADQEEILWKPN